MGFANIFQPSNRLFGQVFAPLKRTDAATLTARGSAPEEITTGDGARLRLKNPGDPKLDLTPDDVVQHPDAEREMRELLRAHGLDEKRVVEFVLNQHKAAADRRALQERDWALSLAYSEGRQNLGYDDNGKQLLSLHAEQEQDRNVATNHVGMFVEKVSALSTASQPDSTPAPLTTAPVDRAAAREARSVKGHCDRKFSRPQQTRERVQWALKTTTCFLKLCWDAGAEALVPQYDARGEIAGAAPAPVGEIAEFVCPAFEVFLDPLAKKPTEARWAVHVKSQPLSWFQTRYGARGFRVKADKGATAGLAAGYVDAYLDGGSAGGAGAASPAGRAGNGETGREEAATCREYWELPSPRYKEGRLIIVAGDVLAYYGPWPYKKRDALPFVPLTFRPLAGSCYGQSLAQLLVPLQAAWKRVFSSTIDQAENQVDYVAVEKGAAIGADAFMERSKVLQRIDYAKGAREPRIYRGPGISGDRFTLLDLIYKQMQDLAGIHDPLSGKAPAGVTAGISIELLQQADQTQLAPFISDIEASSVAITEWEIALYEQYAGVERLMGLDDSGNAEEAHSGALALKALVEGGQTRVICTPGSAMPKSAAGQKQEAIELYNLGVFGPPGSPEACRMLVELLNLPQSDRIMEHIDRLQAAAEAKEAEMLAIQQEQEQAALAAQAQAATPPGSAGPDPLAVEAARSEGRAREAQVRAETESAKMGRQAQIQDALAERQHGRDIQKTLLTGLMKPAAAGKPGNGPK